MLYTTNIYSQSTAMVYVIFALYLTVNDIDEYSELPEYCFLCNDPCQAIVSNVVLSKAALTTLEIFAVYISLF